MRFLTLRDAKKTNSSGVLASSSFPPSPPSFLLPPSPAPPPPPGEKIVQLIMEYVPLGSLRDYLPKHPVGLAHILLFAQQICEVSLTPAPSPPTTPEGL